MMSKVDAGFMDLCKVLDGVGRITIDLDGRTRQVGGS